MTEQLCDAGDELPRLRRRIAELERELAERDAFIVAAAHELRNPISPLLLQVQRLSGTARAARDDHISARWLGEQLAQLERRLGRFLVAVNRLLDVSQLRNGRIELRLEPVELAELTREVAAGFERELAASGSTLSLRADAPVDGTWDRMRLEQIVANLLSNAIRYGDGKPIEVLVRARGERAELVVSDRGVGIAEAEQARIFALFERAGARPSGGFGVGLWVVRGLCRALGGEVSVASRPGEGATFTVTLPRSTDGRGE